MPAQPTLETPLKVTPLCPVFGTCGGCAYQDLPYEEELGRKERMLKGLFRETLGLGGEFFEPVVPSPEPYFYRHRLDLTIKRLYKKGSDPNTNGVRPQQILMGFQQADSRRVVPITSCVISRKEISDFIPELSAQAAEKLPADYCTANLVVKTGDDGRVVWGGIGRRSLRLEPEKYLWTQVRGRKIFYSLDTFFQANLSILPKLMEVIGGLGFWDSETALFDLYSGVGLFGICFYDQVGKVVMIEDAPPSIELARYNVKFHQMARAEVLPGRVEEVLPGLSSWGLTPLGSDPSKKAVAIVDPPRKGLQAKALKILVRTHAFSSLFYLSCNPAALVKDLAGFLEVGWKIGRIVPFDFFPKTVHLETLVWLRR